jgi:hypothetical protein
VLHQFFDLPEFASTLVTLVPFKHIFYLSLSLSLLAVIVVVIVAVPSIPALSTELPIYLPGWLRVVIK